MRKILKDNWKFLLFVLVSGLIGGYFLGIYVYDSPSFEILSQLKEQNVSKDMIIISTMFQYSILYGVVLAFIGIILSHKVGLWKSFKLDKKAIIPTVIVTVLSSLILYPIDMLVFGHFNDWVRSQYSVGPTIYKIIGGLLVGGVIEEVMMRLFLMSLFVFIIKKLFYKNSSDIPYKVYVISNIISSLLFALGHIPSTSMMTQLDSILLFRCIFLNGGIGLLFGYLYRKYGIMYAIFAHGFSHLLSDIMMIICL